VAKRSLRLVAQAQEQGNGGNRQQGMVVTGESRHGVTWVLVK
jgi:hypothetical protein